MMVWLMVQAEWVLRHERAVVAESPRGNSFNAMRPDAAFSAQREHGHMPDTHRSTYDAPSRARLVDCGHQRESTTSVQATEAPLSPYYGSRV